LKTLTLVAADNPVLRQKATLVQQVTGAHRRTGHQMRDLVRNSATGVGLAANQVGITKRIITVQWGGYDLIIVNPELDQFSDEQAVDIEGCLTLPGVDIAIARPTSCRVNGYRIGPLRNRSRAVRSNGYPMAAFTVTGFLARILQHEVDHLDGVMISDHEDHMEEYRDAQQTKLSEKLASSHSRRSSAGGAGEGVRDTAGNQAAQGAAGDP
jgi:peptide deformylase